VLGALPAGERDRAWMPVGRLDLDTTGVLLLTTDGELAHRLTHPRWKVAKRYRALLEQPATPADIEAFAQGISVDGERWLPAELVVGADPRDAWVTLREGRYHQVKRMFGVRGNRVLRLHREAFGPVELPADLAVGGSRDLTAGERQALYAAVEWREEP
jgi:16S rRNA pseudouridine516 synthase